MAQIFRVFVGAVTFICAMATVHAESFEVTADEWARPRSGSRIVAIAALQNVIDEISRQPEATITIQYAGGDDGLLWAEELRGWFVALGVSGEQIALRPGLQDRDRLVLTTE
jgi:hypothetical protein